jgi:phage-related protein
VRTWLKGLPDEDRRIIGLDIATVEYGWPVGMPIFSAITGRRGLWEVRSSLPGGRIARVFFCTQRGRLVLLHGILKKTEKTPDSDLDLAMKRKKEVDR